MARLPPLEEQEWTDMARQAISPTIRSVAVMMGDDDISRPEHQKPLNILLTLAHNDQLIGPIFDLSVKGNGNNGDMVTVTVVASDGSLSSGAATATATVTPGKR